MTSVASCFRFPFARCTDTVKSPLPVHFALSSFSVLPSRIGTKLRSSSASPLLFALYSSTFAALTLGEFFTVQLVAGRVRVGRILSPGIREQPASFAQSRVSFLRLSRTLSSPPRKLLIATLFFSGRSDATVYSDITMHKLLLSIILSKTCSSTL